jgi:hypothetical protein
MSMTQKAQIRVVGPEFRELRVSVVAVISSAARGRGAAVIQEKVTAYLNPITGGEFGTGWGFEATLHADKLRAVIASLPEVRAVTSVTFDDRRLLVRLSGRSLPWPPSHDDMTLDLTEEEKA